MLLAGTLVLFESVILLDFLILCRSMLSIFTSWNIYHSKFWSGMTKFRYVWLLWYSLHQQISIDVSPSISLPGSLSSHQYSCFSSSRSSFSSMLIFCQILNYLKNLSFFNNVSSFTRVWPHPLHHQHVQTLYPQYQIIFWSKLNEVSTVNLMILWLLCHHYSWKCTLSWYFIFSGFVSILDHIITTLLLFSVMFTSYVEHQHIFLVNWWNFSWFFGTDTRSHLIQNGSLVQWHLPLLPSCDASAWMSNTCTLHQI